jgi:hypothetical protein
VLGRYNPLLGSVLIRPQISARQNAFCEREDALHVQLVGLAGVKLDSRERELGAQLLGRGGRGDGSGAPGRPSRQAGGAV